MFICVSNIIFHNKLILLTCSLNKTNIIICCPTNWYDICFLIKKLHQRYTNMKKVILLVLVTLFTCAGYSQAQTTEKKMTRQEKKEAQKAMEQALFNEAKQAIENKAFTLEADRVIFKRGRNAFVSSNTNFVMVDGDKASVQVAFNIPASGPNGLGGVTVDGNVSGYKIKTDKKGTIYLSMSVMGVGISAQVSITVPHGSNNATVDIRPNFNSNRLTLSGVLLPLDKSNVFKGRSF